MPISGVAMIQDVFSALWFIAFLIVVYGIPMASSLFVETDDSLVVTRSPSASGASSRAKSGDA
jgi:capsule polysaccharide export protein KpsE/RkpR